MRSRWLPSATSSPSTAAMAHPPHPHVPHPPKTVKTTASQKNPTVTTNILKFTNLPSQPTSRPNGAKNASQHSLNFAGHSCSSSSRSGTLGPLYKLHQPSFAISSLASRLSTSNPIHIRQFRSRVYQIQYPNIESKSPTTNPHYSAEVIANIGILEVPK